MAWWLSSVMSFKMQRKAVRDAEKKERVVDKWVIGQAEEPTKVCNVQLLEEEHGETSIISEVEGDDCTEAVMMCVGMQQYGWRDGWAYRWIHRWTGESMGGWL